VVYIATAMPPLMTFIDDFIDAASKLSSVASGSSIRMNPTIVPSKPSLRSASPAKAPNCIGDLSLSASPRNSNVWSNRRSRPCFSALTTRLRI